MKRHKVRPRQVVVRREWERPVNTFTQGLSIAFGSLWESMGLYGLSGIREICPEISELRWSGTLPDWMSARGYAIRRAVCDSWREGVAVQWDLVRRRICGEVAYAGRDGG